MAGAGQPIEWYLARDNKQYGPVGEAEIAKLIELRHLRDQDLVWRAGFSDWMPAATVFPQAFPPPPPAPAVSQAEAPAPAPLRAPDQLAPPAGPEPTEPADRRAMAPGPVAEPPHPQPANVETLSDYRARAGGRQESAVASPAHADDMAPAHAAMAPAPAMRATAPTQQRRLWIAPEDAEPMAAAQAPQWPDPRERLAAPQARYDQRPAGHGPLQPHPAMAPPPGQAPRTADAIAAGFGRPQRPAAPLAPMAPAPGPAMTASRPEPSPARLTPARVDPEIDFDDEDEEPRKRRWGRKLLGLFTILTLLALIGGGTWMALMQPQDFRQMMRSLGIGDAKPAAGRADAPPAATTTGKAPTADRRSAGSGLAAAKATAPVLPAAPLQAFADSAPAIDQSLQTGRLWQLIKAEFPDWYEERVREVQRLVAEKRPDEAITKHLVDAVVALRRKNADHALQASPPRLQLIARTFRDSLDTLVRHSQVACFSLISSGEGSRGMVSLFRDPQYGPALQGTLAAVFEAIAEGRKAPATVLPARRGDYDLLTRELTGLGWSESDLSLFADSQQLSRSSPEQVCRMVREWFTAHLAVPDRDVQTRLLVESVRPVVAG